MPAPLRLIHRVDPADQIMSAVRPWIEKTLIRPYDVMIAMYLREKIEGEKMTASGIILADNGAGSLREDLYQGKVGLVVKVGSQAFIDETDHKWEGFKPDVGNWVVINVSDTFSFNLPGGWLIRIVDENFVRMIVPVPDSVW